MNISCDVRCTISYSLCTKQKGTYWHEETMRRKGNFALNSIYKKGYNKKIRSKCCMPYHDMKSVKNGQVARPSGKGKDR